MRAVVAMLPSLALLDTTNYGKLKLWNNGTLHESGNTPKAVRLTDCSVSVTAVIKLSVGLVNLAFILSLLLSLSLYMIDPNRLASELGAFSSFCFAVIPLSIGLRKRQSFANGAVALAATQLAWPSFLTWKFKEFHYWPENRRGRGSTDAFQLDTFCMVSLSAACVAMVLQKVSSSVDRVALLVVSTLVLLCHLIGAWIDDFNGSLVQCFDEITVSGIIFVFAATSFSKRKCFVNALHYLFSTTVVVVLHIVVMRAVEGPLIPRIKDCVAGYWHQAIATGVVFLVLDGEEKVAGSDADFSWLFTITSALTPFVPAVSLAIPTDNIRAYYATVYGIAIGHSLVLLACTWNRVRFAILKLSE